MKNAITLLAAAVSLSGVGHADKTADNLIGLQTSDFCGTPTSAIAIDDKEDSALSNKLNQAMLDQDILFNTGFNKRGNCNMFIGFYALAMSVKNNSGAMIGYAYSYSFQVFSISGRIEVRDRYTQAKVPIIYDIRSMGVTGSDKQKFESLMMDEAKGAFQAFLLDWRKTR